MFIITKEYVTYIHVAPRRLYSTIDQNFNLECEGDQRKNSYERRVYESVDDRSLS